ncbi:MAG: hypothetical protein LUD72_14605 [Bacteroidales bacterium]|nr:hypothetical protein [Bacteroidales bacterium]
MAEEKIEFNTDAVSARLAEFGYTVDSSSITEQMLLQDSVEKVRSTIKNYINWQDVPEGLYYVAVDMAVGEFLMAKKTWDPESLENSGLDLGVGIKTLTEGDKTTTFATGESGSQTDEQRLDDFIDHLRNDGMNQLACFRRIRW